jgi:hypothetical protein
MKIFKVPRLSVIGLIALPFLLVAGAAQAAMVVNGSFEDNSAVHTEWNLLNAPFSSLLTGVTAFGAREGIDLQTIGSGWGSAPQDGNWKVSPASDFGGTSEAFTMDLTGPLTKGRSYNLSFYIEPLLTGAFQDGTVLIGLSTSATSFGTQIFSATARASGWTLESTTFLAPNSGSFLSVLVTNDVNSWVGLDNFTLESSAAVPVPAAVWLFGSALLGLGVVKRKKAWLT